MSKAVLAHTDIYKNTYIDFLNLAKVMLRDVAFALAIKMWKTSG